MQTISAILLCTTATELLQKAVDSVLFCDEVIILSDDATVTKKSLPRLHHKHIHIHHVPLSQDFSKKRNIGLQLATSDWALFIDADEYVSKELRQEIQERIMHSTIQGFFVKRVDRYMGRLLLHGEPACVYLLRLARVNSGSWKRPVHEYWDVRGNTDILSFPLHHLPHTNISSFLQKIILYTSIETAYRIQLNRSFSLFEFICYPIGKFLYTYIFQFGFLDGFPGLSMAVMMSIHSMSVRIMMYEKQ